MMKQDKRKGFWAGYKRLGPTQRFLVNLSIIAVIISVLLFAIQWEYGASKNLQREAQKDREAKHKELKVHLESLDRKIQIQESSYGEMREVVKEIIPKFESSETLQKLFLSREVQETSKYYPSGYKLEGSILGPTDISRKLKIVFRFMNDNFSEEITGKQFKEINKVLEEVTQVNPLLPYVWFYRGMLFSFVKADKELGDNFFRIGQKYFIEADKRFDLLLNKYPEDPFLLLYKGMTLTHLSNGKESIIYLRKALQIDPGIFKKHRLLGIISIWKHIDQSFVDEWEAAFVKYWE